MIDLDREARVFAAEVSELLNHTVTNGIRLSAVITHRNGTNVLVGKGLIRRNFVADPIPLTINARQPVGYLQVAYTLAADPEETYLAVVKSHYGLYSADQLDGMVVHWDYDREPDHIYPAAHVQVKANARTSINSLRTLEARVANATAVRYVIFTFLSVDEDSDQRSRTLSNSSSSKESWRYDPTRSKS